MKSISVGAFVCAFLCTKIMSASIIDQQFVGQSGTGSATAHIGWSNEYQQSQTFTVGRTGSLTAVDVYVIALERENNPLVVDVRRVVNGAPTTGDSGPHILASATIAKQNVPTAASLPGPLNGSEVWGGPMLHVDLPDFPVSAGEQLAITVRSNDIGVGYMWIHTLEWMNQPHNLGYAEGNLFAWYANDWVDYTEDGGFRTYVTPEPTSLVLAGMVTSLWLVARRRR